MNRLCKCGHTRYAHQHHRPGTNCGLCDCPRYRRPWFPRLTRNWRTAAAIIADEQDRATSRKPPAPAATTPRAPGNTPGAGPAAGPHPNAAAPAPGHLRNGLHHRGDHTVTDGWECGCVWAWDRRTGWTLDYDHLDAALERLTRDQR